MTILQQEFWTKMPKIEDKTRQKGSLISLLSDF